MPELSIPEEYRFSPGLMFEDGIYNENPRRRRSGRRKGRVPPQFLRHPPRSWRRNRRRGGRHSRRRSQHNPRFGRHRPVLYNGGRGWRAGRRSRLGIRGHRVNRRHRRNPIVGGSSWMRLPAKGDFGHGWKANTGAVLAVVGGLAIPGLSGWAYNMAFDKWLADPVSEFAGDYTPHVKTLSRLGVKAAVGLGSAYAVAKMTHKPHLGRLMVLGTVIALIIDGISAVAGVAIGSQNPFGKAIIMRGTPKPTIKGAVLNTFGLGEAAIAYSAFRDGNLAKSGVRILQHPSGSMGLYAPGKGIIMEGKPSAVLGRYHTIMSARSRGLGEMISIESGMRGQPWVGEADI